MWAVCNNNIYVEEGLSQGECSADSSECKMAVKAVVGASTLLFPTVGNDTYPTLIKQYKKESIEGENRAKWAANTCQIWGRRCESVECPRRWGLRGRRRCAFEAVGRSRRWTSNSCSAGSRPSSKLSQKYGSIAVCAGSVANRQQNQWRS